MRNILNINDGWFFKKNCSDVPKAIPNIWVKLNLPHTWDGEDGQDGGNDYFRGKSVYAKELTCSDLPEGEEIYVQFDAVNSSCDVYFNGVKLRSHDGGYSAFRARLTDIKEKNIIAVVVDNAENDRVYPQMADFTFYGGIYRDVTLIGVAKNHFDLDYYATDGVFVTPTVYENNAAIKIKARADGEVRFKITDGETVIAETTVVGKNPEAEMTIENVHLWNGTADPFMYTLISELLCGGEAVDTVITKFGCRSFKVDPENGFYLNGKSMPLRGVARHQDRPKIGNALKREHHEQDVSLICEMGANTVRLAHYQHSQIFYDLCDEKGLIVWAEIPYISKHMPNGDENTYTQMTELVLQNFNHPSIVFWGLSNEITLNGKPDKKVIENHKKLNSLVHSLDKTRLTTLAAVSMCSVDNKYVHISDVVSYNLYFGWYGGKVGMTGPWLDRFHKKHPDKPIGLSEYGAEALNWHTSKPKQGDYTEEYQAYYHEEHIKQIAERNYLWATHVWNMFDFAADARAEGGENGMNHKGLVTFDREYKKDAFYAYKAWLSSSLMIHLCGKRYIDRVEPITRVTVYSNCDEVELFVNGKSIEKQRKGKYPFFYFNVANEGESVITVKAGELSDSGIIRKVDKPNEKYILQDEGEVINWFDISTPTGYFSVNDTIGDIASTFRGKLFLLRVSRLFLRAFKGHTSDSLNEGEAEKETMSKGVSLMGLKINKSLLEMVKGFTVKRAIVMVDSGFSKKQILKINDELNRIKKPKKAKNLK